MAFRIATNIHQMALSISPWRFHWIENQNANTQATAGTMVNKALNPSSRPKVSNYQAS